MKVYIGYDRKQHDAYKVLVKSIRKYNKYIPIIAIVKDQLRAMDLYKRFDSNDESTDFTHTRFFVPYLSGYKDFSLYLDLDMLVTADISMITNHLDTSKKVMCVQHPDYEVNSNIKMDGKTQKSYPRKNWSSVMLFNNAACKELTPELINSETPAYLHRLTWAYGLVGELPKTWNHLVGYYPKKRFGYPKIIHYTDGGPWYKEYENCDYADLWRQIKDGDG